MSSKPSRTCPSDWKLPLQSPFRLPSERQPAAPFLALPAPSSPCPFLERPHAVLEDRHSLKQVSVQVHLVHIRPVVVVLARFLLRELVGVLPLDELGVLARDRKSTRLNSSHPSISYAVFCLKK